MSGAVCCSNCRDSPCRCETPDRANQDTSTDAREVLESPTGLESGRKYILFDIDGTLCTSRGLGFDWACLSKVTRKDIRLDNTEVSQTADTDLSHVHHILRHHGIPEEDIDNTCRAFFGESQPGAEQWGLTARCPGVMDALDWIRRTADQVGCAVTLGIWTGNSKTNAIVKLEAAGIPLSYFDFRISAFGDECPTKLALFELIQRVIERTYEASGLDMHSILLVGDAPWDIRVASSVGCRSVAVTTGAFGAGELAPLGPDALVSNLTEAFPFFRMFLSGKLEQH